MSLQKIGSSIVDLIALTAFSITCLHLTVGISISEYAIYISIIVSIFLGPRAVFTFIPKILGVFPMKRSTFKAIRLIYFTLCGVIQSYLTYVSVTKIGNHLRTMDDPFDFYMSNPNSLVVLLILMPLNIAALYHLTKKLVFSR